MQTLQANKEVLPSPAMRLQGDGHNHVIHNKRLTEQLNTWSSVLEAQVR